MKVTYCKSWFRAFKEPTELWSAETAEKAHKQRKPYCALIGEPNAPTCFLEVNNDYIGVGFLDDKLRENLSYQFQEVEPGKLFLSMAVFREFKGNTDEVVSGTMYLFSQDGKVSVEKENYQLQEVETSETETDVSGNYEMYPEFGKYDRLIRNER